MPEMNDMRYVRESVPLQDRLCQLAEEAAELAQAALKARRAITPGNPTPVDIDTARRQLIEEIGDVECCIEAICFPVDHLAADLVRKAKTHRWAERLRAQREELKIDEQVEK